jgi:hypothetical protein
MTQLGKISQRRFLLDQFCFQILTMPSTESERCRPPIPVCLGKVVGMPSEQVVGMLRNEWTASIRIDGRHGPDYAPKRRRNSSKTWWGSIFNAPMTT